MFRYTWPGRDEAYACVEHAKQLKNVAQALGFHLQMIPLTGVIDDEEIQCAQFVRADKES